MSLTGHIQQVFQGFDCPISLKSIFCSHQDTAQIIKKDALDNLFFISNGILLRQ